MKEYIVHWCDTRNTCGGSVTVDAEDRNGAEESAAVRESLETMGYTLEEISVSDFMTALFPDKRIFYRLSCDQYGQPSGQIEKYRMTPGEYAVEKRYEEENHLAMWFDTYESALNRADD